jgi:uncharacterized protein with ParB-like and HNH nuclease domain
VSVPKGIHGIAKNVFELLMNKKYKLDYYQREYTWETSNIIELLEDLTSKFFVAFDKNDNREDVKKYPTYFLGSIVINEKESGNFIIDGQQRLTSLTLLLMYLNNLQQNIPEKVSLDYLIFSESFGKKSFNLEVDERDACMAALYKNSILDVTNANESVKNLYARYQDIKENFPEDLENNSLPFFIDWLLNRVEMVEIRAFSDEDAYTIFETMNDRGVTLNPTDMLKGYLLTNMHPDSRLAANQLWRSQVGDLIKIDKNEETNFFKVWLRAKYAQSIRERKRGAINQDWENINSYHRWLRHESKELKLENPNDFSNIVTCNFKFFSTQHIRNLIASVMLSEGMEYVYYNASNEFTLQYPLLLAPLKTADDNNVIDKKIRLVAGYIDIFIARRVWNQRTLGYSSIVYTMFNLMKEIRDKTVEELVSILTMKVQQMEETFESYPAFSLNQQNRRYIHRLLARITQHIEEQSGIPSRYEDYISSEIAKPFEIEHIWAKKFDYHTDEFDNDYEFQEYRNRIGGLLLVQRGFNQSYGELPYVDKLPLYFGQNLLAKSLNPNCYKSNPSFETYIKASGLQFQAHQNFKKSDLEQRMMLYKEICKEIWNPNRFAAELMGTV